MIASFFRRRVQPDTIEVRVEADPRGGGWMRVYIHRNGRRADSYTLTCTTPREMAFTNL